MKKYFISLLIMLLGISLVEAFNLSSFSNGLTAENLTFTNGQNITRYLAYPLGANVLNFSINISLIDFQNSPGYYTNRPGNISVFHTNPSTNPAIIDYSIFESNGLVNITVQDNTASGAAEAFVTYDINLSTVNYTFTIDSFASSSGAINNNIFIGLRNFTDCPRAYSSVSCNTTTGNQAIKIIYAISQPQNISRESYIMTLNGTHAVVYNLSNGAILANKALENWPATYLSFNVEQDAVSGYKRQTLTIHNVTANRAPFDLWISGHPVKSADLNTTRTIGASVNKSSSYDYFPLACDCPDCVISNNQCLAPVTFRERQNSIVQYNNIYANVLNSCMDFCTRSCGNLTNATALNVSFLQTTGAPTSLPVEVSLPYSYSANGPIIGNLSNTFASTQSFLLCVYPNEATLYTDMFISYTDSGTTFTYQTDNTPLNNITQYLNLSLQGTTTPVLFTVLDTNGIIVPNAFITILEYNPGTNSYRNTELLRTGSAGTAVGNLVLLTNYYKFIVSYNGQPRLIDPETGGTVVYTSSKTFRINLGSTIWRENLATTQGAHTSLTYNNDTFSFIYTWYDETGLMHNGCLKVVQRNVSGTRTVSDVCQYATASSLLYTTGNIQPGNTFVATGYFSFHDNYITDILERAVGNTIDFVKNDRTGISLFFGFLITVSMGLLGLPNPAISLILFGVGFVISVLLGFISLAAVTVGGVVTISILIIVLLFRMRAQ